MSPQIIVIGISPAGKVPSALFNVNFGVGLASVGSVPRYLLLLGQMVSGTATPDTQVTPIFPNTDIGAAYGLRSELAQMITVARQTPGVQIMAAAVAAPGGSPAAATATITFAGTATAAGTWQYYVAGQLISLNVANGDTPAVQATNAAAAFTANATIPVTAASSAGVVTLTVANAGLRGNDWTLYQDITQAPGTTTSALGTASSYAVSSPSGGVTGVRFGGGTGTDVLTNVLGTLQGTAYFTVAAAQNDVTNAGLLRTYNIAKAAIGSQLFEHIILGQNGSLATATTLAQTTLNNPRFQVPWMRGSEAHPSMIAAAMGAIRTQYDQVNPNQSFDGVTLPGIPPARAAVDRPSPGETGEQQTALAAGITPINTTKDGYAIIVRSVTTMSMRSGSAFYGTDDTGKARTPDVAAEQLVLAWQSDFSVQNKWVNSDPAENQKAPPAGVATPSIWSAYANNLLGEQIQNNWFSAVNVSSQYDPNAKQLLTTISLTVTPQNHRIAGNINQTF